VDLFTSRDDLPLEVLGQVWAGDVLGQIGQDSGHNLALEPAGQGNGSRDGHVASHFSTTKDTNSTNEVRVKHPLRAIASRWLAFENVDVVRAVERVTRSVDGASVLVLGAASKATGEATKCGVDDTCKASGNGSQVARLAGHDLGANSANHTFDGRGDLADAGEASGDSALDTTETSSDGGLDTTDASSDDARDTTKRSGDTTLDTREDRRDGAVQARNDGAESAKKAAASDRGSRGASDGVGDRSRCGSDGRAGGRSS